MNINAVITADIVASTQLSRTDSKKLMKNLLLLLNPHLHEFFRGDSFQVYVKSAEDALPLLLQLKTVALKTLTDTSAPVTDIKACIGIGSVKLPVKTLRTANDEAFILSGRQFDKMKPAQRVAIVCSEKNETAGIGLRVIAQFLDYIFLHMTPKQASVVFELLMKRTQIETARRLKKSQATVHKHTQSSGWPEIEKLVGEYRLLTNTIQA